MKSADIREAFLRYFEQQNHSRQPSSSLVPGNDPTLLFTNAGMVPFKDVFLGLEQRPYKRATTSQRCVRAGGKHNDLENVGYTARHHTFFEMLGNFSFGDYFKKDAIAYAWEFLTSKDWMAIPEEKLTVTVYADDQEAFDIWHKTMGLPEEKIIRIGDNKGEKYASDNFWAMGDTGPCGPCTEIFYDHGEHIWGGLPGTPEEDGDRFIEIWNIVFMQYERSADGTMNSLPNPSIDTGMGLERIAALMQGVHNNYEIDLFDNLLNAVVNVTGVNDKTNQSLRVIADHIRSCAFLIVDGVMPANEGRGYVLRRILRRAVRHAHKLGVTGTFFHKLVQPLADEMGAAYPELANNVALVEKTILAEEKQFAKTLDHGMKRLLSATSEAVPVARYYSEKLEAKIDGYNIFSTEGSYDAKLVFSEHAFLYLKIIEDVKLSKQIFNDTTDRLQPSWDQNKLLFLIEASTDNKEVKVFKKEVEDLKLPKGWVVAVEVYHEADLQKFKYLSGEMAFTLYDTFGFPLDLTADFCREKGFYVDEQGYEAAMAEQRKRSQTAGQFAVDYTQHIQLEGETEFIGYQHLAQDVDVLALYQGTDAVEALNEGQEGVVVLKQTPFYAESGGQVGDAGFLYQNGAKAKVLDVTKSGQHHLHHIKVVSGSLNTNAKITAEVNETSRLKTALNHSATHLLHAALREILGEHVTQKGSLNDADKLRFDFSHNKAVTAEQLAAIETRVNEQIRLNSQIETDITDIETAKEKGAMALFGEKYGSEVRVLTMGGGFSVELCGGTHANRTGDIGLLRITSEQGVASGVRRIEAVTASRAMEYTQAQTALLQQSFAALKARPESFLEKLQSQLQNQKQLEKTVEQLKAKLAASAGGDLNSEAVEVNGIKVLAAKIEGADRKSLLATMDQLKNKLGDSVILLATTDDKGIALVAGVAKAITNKVKAGDLMKEMSGRLGGKGGGRPDSAQGGGTDVAALDEVLGDVANWVKEQTS